MNTLLIESVPIVISNLGTILLLAPPIGMGVLTVAAFIKTVRGDK